MHLDLEYINQQPDLNSEVRQTNPLKNHEFTLDKDYDPYNKL